MNRKWLLVGTSIVLALCIIGGTYYYWNFARIQTRNFNPLVEINPQENYTIEIWDFKNPHIYISEEMQIETWQVIVDEFKEIYPNIHLDVKLLEEEDYIDAIEKGMRNNKMADIVIDWLGTPIIDPKMQIPVHKYFDLSSDKFLEGTIEYLKYDDGLLGYPLIAIPNVLIGNLEILDQHVNVIKIANEGWTMEEFYQAITDIKENGKSPVNIFDYYANFTRNFLVQGGIDSITKDGKINWYGYNLGSIYMDIDKYKKEELVTYNDLWLADFWRGQVGLLAGPQTWVITETFNRNQALEENEIRGAGSNKQTETIILPYPYKPEIGVRYGMELVSAIPFSQRNYKGEDHSKAVMELLSFMNPIYSLKLGTIHGFIPANQELIKQWSEQNGLDPYSNRSLQISAMDGKPIRSRHYRENYREIKALEEIQPILDKYWSNDITLQGFMDEIGNKH